MEINLSRRLLKRSNERLRRKSLGQPIWQGMVKKEGA
jgi:hypothetical protein